MIPKFCKKEFCFMALLLLVSWTAFTLAISSLNSILIKNTGRILLTSSLRNKSEIRVMFVHCLSFPADWALIANVAKEFNFDVINIEIGSPSGVYYTSDVAHDWWVEGGQKDELAACIQAAHIRGLKVWANFDFMTAPASEVMEKYGEMRAMSYNPETKERYYIDWTCPSSPNSKKFFHDIAAELAYNFDIDGLMFDYIRYDYKEMCYCDYCKNKFITDTGITNLDWPKDVYSGGKYDLEFMKWRVRPITEIVEDVVRTMRSIKPNIEFALAAWAIFDENAGPYWRYYIGQDAADWINRDLIEYVSPMIYDWDIDSFTECVKNSIEVFIGVSKGKIPIIPSITTGIDEPRPLELFAQQVEILRSYGCDGFQVWRYGGPGSTHSICNVRDYLERIDLPQTFSIVDIKMSTSNTTATITWSTTKSATSIVEYSTSPLFPGILKIGYGGFLYWDIEYFPGIIIENKTKATFHEISLTGLAPNTTYYFRVQSRDETGTATSKVLAFTIR